MVETAKKTKKGGRKKTSENEVVKGKKQKNVGSKNVNSDNIGDLEGNSLEGYSLKGLIAQLQDVKEKLKGLPADIYRQCIKELMGDDESENKDTNKSTNKSTNEQDAKANDVEDQDTESKEGKSGVKMRKVEKHYQILIIVGQEVDESFPGGIREVYDFGERVSSKELLDRLLETKYKGVNVKVIEIDAPVALID